ncbi:DUF4386 domain-containing protein, partial [Pontibacter saemangeumensis]|uniref:DUF4386 domain-containing protein n=1 Tax=Pontibacter saemangeumensis TaxID=1084525 RepID=UPI0031EAC021
IILDVLLSVSLYALFHSAGKSTAWLMVSLRLAYVAVKGFAIVGLFLARDMYSAPVGADAVQVGVYAAQAMQFLKMHHYGFAVGLIFFGLHLIFLALLLLKVNGIPRLFAWMLLSAGVGYGMNSLVSLFAPDFALLKITVIAVFIIPMTFSELAFGVWLWVRHKSAAPPLTA